MAAYLAKLNCGFYYGLLGIDEQTIFKSIGRAVCEYRDCVRVTDCTAGELRRIVTAIKYDNPEFFYWNQENPAYSAGVLELNYRTKGKDEAENLLQEVRMERKRIIDTCRTEGQQSVEELFGAVYQYLLLHTEYGYEELQMPQMYKWVYELDGALLKKRAVCLGIAQMLNYFCEALHMKSLLITGEARFGTDTVNHGWNMVKCKEGYRHFDLTADLCEHTQKKYFMCTDENFKERKWAKNVYPKV